jgi:hypothetical protein
MGSVPVTHALGKDLAQALAIPATPAGQARMRGSVAGIGEFAGLFCRDVHAAPEALGIRFRSFL